MQRQGAAQALDERVSGVMHRHLVTSVCQLLGSEVMVTSIPVGLDLRSDHSLFLAHSSLIFKATVLCTTPPEEWAGQTLELGLPGPTPPKAAALQVPAQPGRSEGPPCVLRPCGIFYAMPKRLSFTLEVRVSQSFFSFTNHF